MRKQTLFILFVIFIVIILCGGSAFSVPGLFDAARKQMVEEQLKGRDITDAKVLKVMGEVPRHEFVPVSLVYAAYKDHPLPIGEGQTISQPYIVALMTEVLGLKPDDRVLEIGTGSGYQAAVLGRLVKEVYTIEIKKGLAAAAKERLSKAGYKNVHVKTGDGYYGWPEESPFNAIMITAAASFVPPPLMKQLADGGRLVIPLGSAKYYQTLTLITKKAGKIKTRHITNVRFVPMTGRVLE